MVFNYIKSDESRKKGAFDEEAREALIIKHARQVERIAAGIARRLPSSVQIEDLINAGSLGLIKAVDNYDPSQEASFQTYAEYRIRGAIQDELRRMDWFSRSLRKKMREVEAAARRVELKTRRAADDWEIARELGLAMEDYAKTLTTIHDAAIFSFDEFIRNQQNDASGGQRFLQGLAGSDDPIDSFSHKEMKQMVAQAIASLSEKEQLITSLYYFDEMTLKEIGQILELTESRICQIHAGILVKLKSRLTAYFENQGAKGS